MKAFGLILIIFLFTLISCDETEEVKDPCRNITCSSHGTCSVVADDPVCNCESGYHAEGIECVIDSATVVTSCKIQWPPTIAGNVSDSINVYGQVKSVGVTERQTEYANMKAQLGVTTNQLTFPLSGDFNWINGTFNNDCSTCNNTHEYTAPFPTTQAGNFNYIFRFSTNNGTTWTYCDVNGIISSSNITGGTAVIQEAQPCNGIVCDEWKECVNDVCELKSGRCENNSQCTDNKICDETHNCITQTNPCENQNCSSHGTCVVENNTAKCNCDEGYVASGLSCVEQQSEPITSVEWGAKRANVTSTGTTLKTYTITTNVDLMDNIPANKQRVVTEESSEMTLRTNNIMFDAVFALALDEVVENSVSNINDGGFNNGANVPCECFETGRKWKYVWTRDTSYAVNLALAMVNPSRSKNSLSFKISNKKSIVGGGNKQIIQDTGSGGSWPISTDRVVWALGAYETLKYLDGTERTQFLSDAYEAIKNTAEADRVAIYDSIDGLYTGEQSFLDWREQTYPFWTANDTVHLGMSKTLSTNVLHYILLDVGSKLATEKGDNTTADKFNTWKNDLKTAISLNFYLNDENLFAAMKTTYLSNAAIKKFDLLGQSLAVISGVASDIESENCVSHYPLTDAGPAVIWPQEPSTRVYHNRAIWPFVTAYALRAAKKVENDAAYNNAVFSLYRGSAFNLSNMENFEFTTLANNYYDSRKDYSNRDLTGPVVNSQRQLWSVAGYISMVVEGIFGLSATQTGIKFEPKISKSVRNTIFASTSVITLKNFKYKGKVIDITITLPEISAQNTGFLITNEIRLNGTLKTGEITASELSATNTLEITMKDGTSSGEIVLKSCSDESNCFAPHATSITSVIPSNGKLNITFSASSGNSSYGISSVTYNIYRDGVLIASNITSPWSDPNSGDYANKSYCYSVTAISNKGLESHISSPICYWGESYNRIETVSATAFSQVPNATDHGRPHFADWGKTTEELVVPSFVPLSTGTYLMQIEYGSGRPIDTGITACFKTVEIYENGTNQLIAADYIVMPHLGGGNWDFWGNSSFLEVQLNNTKTYKIVIKDFLNMSYFNHFVIYTAGAGGGEDVYNRANIGGIKFLLKEK